MAGRKACTRASTVGWRCYRSSGIDGSGGMGRTLSGGFDWTRYVFVSDTEEGVGGH